MTRVCGTLLLVLPLLFLSHNAHAQSAPKHEFRGAWVTTVLGLNWPAARSASTADKTEALIQILDSLKAVGVNAVLFQVRAESDALYASDLEPWSYWLTEKQGRAPTPFFDPLQFVIAEAHARGMKLHAWFNPFRAARPGSNYERAASHVVNEHPDWLLTFDDGLTVYDILGRGVLRTQASLSAGSGQETPIDAAPLASGVYLYRVTVRMDDDTDQTATGKMVKAK